MLKFNILDPIFPQKKILRDYRALQREFSLFWWRAVDTIISNVMHCKYNAENIYLLALTDNLNNE